MIIYDIIYTGAPAMWNQLSTTQKVSVVLSIAAMIISAISNYMSMVATETTLRALSELQR